MKNATRKTTQAAPRPRPPVLMYAAGATAGVFVGILVLWLILPAEAFSRASASEAQAQQAQMVPQPAPAPVEHQHAEEFARISIDDAKAKFDRGEIVLIDVRDMNSYLASHIPGALHIPFNMIEGEIPYLPKDKPIVTYCTCPNEESSGHAVQVLDHGGIAGSAALQGGFQEWTRRGYPTKAGKEH